MIKGIDCVRVPLRNDFNLDLRLHVPIYVHMSKVKVKVNLPYNIRRGVRTQSIPFITPSLQLFKRGMIE